MRRVLCSLVALALTACGGAEPAASSPAEAPPTVTLSVVGTNDLHGRLRALPVFAGYLRALRERRREDGGAVLLLDGGDMFQGTLESNLLEGAPIVEAYGALGYDAVTIGNHEFDYGPVGPSPIPAEPGDDPRGALRARAAEASFPFLSANLFREDDGRVEWENVPASTLVERAGVTIGIIGVTTEETLRTTIAANVVGLRMAPLAESIAREAEALRRDGADVVIVTAHAGGACERFDEPTDLSSCRSDAEIFEVARQLPAGAVDAIVGGHTHQGVAHVVNGVPIIESFAYGRAFGRVDLEVDPASGRVVDVRVQPPRDLCAEGSPDEGDCAPGSYEGRAVTPDERIARLIAPAIDNARAARERPLGVTLDAPIARDRYRESAIGNLFTDLMRAARPEADVALTNGGSLRSDLSAGPLTYGALHQAFPFDNRFAFVRLTGAQLAAIVKRNLEDDGSFFSLSGVRATARCVDGDLRVELERDDGRPVADDDELTVVTTDYLVTGGDGAFAGIPEEAIRIEDGDPVRDGMAAVLERRGGAIHGASLLDPTSPRVRYEGERPIRCEASAD